MHALLPGGGGGEGAATGGGGGGVEVLSVRYQGIRLIAPISQLTLYQRTCRHAQACCQLTSKFIKGNRAMCRGCHACSTPMVHVTCVPDNCQVEASLRRL